jgi:hypothetical protein
MTPAEREHMQRARVLLSYHSYRTANVREHCEALRIDGVAPDVFADSGAFSAYSSGATITVDEYVAWIHRWRDWLTVYANLDVIGDHAASMRNLRELERCGLSPLPVFHTHTDDMGVLEDLCEEYDYVAIGGMVGYSARAIFPWLVRCHKVARKHGTALHGFGLTSTIALSDLPWYSVDSTSWLRGIRFGEVYLFEPRTGEGLNVLIGEETAHRWRAYDRLVRSYGYEPDDFIDRSRATREVMLGMSMIATKRFEQWLRRRHGPITGRGPDGLLLYVAGGGKSDQVVGMNAVTRYLRRYAVADQEVGAQVKEEQL